MRVVANIATQPHRASSLQKVLMSIHSSFTEVNVWHNTGKDLTDIVRSGNVTHYYGKDYVDNAKFIFVKDYYSLDEKVMYFTLDDDLIYPNNYVPTTLANLQIHKGKVVTYHGRKILGLGRQYYTQNKSVGFLQRQTQPERFDVAGTGVSAFEIVKGQFGELYKSDIRLMSDLIFSEECSIIQKEIMHCPHDYGWIKHIENEGIHATFRNKETPIQNKIADDIYTNNYVR